MFGRSDFRGNKDLVGVIKSHPIFFDSSYGDGGDVSRSQRAGETASGGAIDSLKLRESIALWRRGETR